MPLVNAKQTTIIIAGRVHVAPEDVEEFISDARATYPVAAANPGNVLLSFSVEEAATGTVAVLEQWASDEALERHLTTPEVTAVFTKWGPRMRNEVRKFDVRPERHARDIGRSRA